LRALSFHLASRGETGRGTGGGSGSFGMTWLINSFANAVMLPPSFWQPGLALGRPGWRRIVRCNDFFGLAGGTGRFMNRLATSGLGKIIRYAGTVPEKVSRSFLQDQKFCIMGHTPDPVFVPTQGLLIQ